MGLYRSNQKFGRHAHWHLQRGHHLHSRQCAHHPTQNNRDFNLLYTVTNKKFQKSLKVYTPSIMLYGIEYQFVTIYQ